MAYSPWPGGFHLLPLSVLNLGAVWFPHSRFACCLPILSYFSGKSIPEDGEFSLAKVRQILYHIQEESYPPVGGKSGRNITWVCPFRASLSAVPKIAPGANASPNSPGFSSVTVYRLWIYIWMKNAPPMGTAPVNTTATSSIRSC